MMLYVYAIVDSYPFESVLGEGHEGADVVAVPCGACAAAVSVSSSCTIEATPQNVWRHERVLERLMQDHAVLPLRFGTICRDADALRDCLPTSADGHRNDLERVRGKVEIALRIVDHVQNQCAGDAVAIKLDAANDHEPTGRGAAYLRARQQRLRSDMAKEDSGKRLEKLLRQQLGAVLKDVICAPPADPSAGYLASCLVERDQIAAFAHTLDLFRGDHPKLDVTCTGPWAPYSFVTAPPVPQRRS